MAQRTELGGLWAAVLIPRNAAGDVDEKAFRGTLEFLGARGVHRVVLNGATGEYCLTTEDELSRLLNVCRGTEFLCAIGAAGVRGSIRLGKLALDAGARALVLPMPHFFPYAQGDLIEYCERVAGELDAPILLYNLPRFTTPLERSTVQALLERVPNIVGIKDSSGSLEILSALQPEKACRIVGDDRVLASALAAGACDGVISGVAGVLPELMQLVYSGRDPSAPGKLEELIVKLSVFPTPWGLKLVAEARGLGPAHFAQSLSPIRQKQVEEFRTWFASGAASL